jgi:hypothetical protein
METRNRFRVCLLLMGFALTLAPARGNASAEGVEQEHPAVWDNSEDVASIDAIVHALYDVISGPAGEKRDWGRMRSLFLPGARLIATGRRPDGEFVHRTMSVEDYIQANAAALEEHGFIEHEIGRHMDVYGSIVQIFSAYEARRSRDDAKPFLRGINSIQLWSDGVRWWVVTVLWQAETQDNPLPSEYLLK